MSETEKWLREQPRSEWPPWTTAENTVYHVKRSIEQSGGSDAEVAAFLQKVKELGPCGVEAVMEVAKATPGVRFPLYPGAAVVWYSGGSDVDDETDVYVQVLGALRDSRASPEAVAAYCAEAKAAAASGGLEALCEVARRWVWFP